MKTITICGSMKYEKEMHVIAFELETKHGYNVLQCVYNLEKKELTSLDLDALKKAHYKKIDISDGYSRIYRKFSKRRNTICERKWQRNHHTLDL